MIGRLANVEDARAAAAKAMSDALAEFATDRSISVICHFDADGLSAGAILVRALNQAGRPARPMIIGKGESPWDEQVTARLRAEQPGGLIVADLGTRADPVLRGCPTLILDHHSPTGEPREAITLSGNGLTPEPSSSLLAWWAAAALGEQSHLLWLAALGLIGDLAEGRTFPELAQAQARWGKTALREAVSLINAPRRTARADAGPALRLLLRADGPAAITKGQDADVLALHVAKTEVRAAMESAKNAPPLIAGDVAVISLDSACQIHPLIAQQWRMRLRDTVVIAANRGYRPGWVHFAARSASGRDLLEFLARHRPAVADARYGNGHAQATGGALRNADWNEFITSLGLPQAQVPV